MVDWSDAEIDQLLRCRKSIQDAPRRDMKEENRHRRNDMKLRGPEGEQFEVFIRQSLEFPEDFSIGLVFFAPEGKRVTLVRFNGQHEQALDPFQAGVPHFNFHVHKATPDNLNMGRYEKHPADTTQDYASLDEAIVVFCKYVCIQGWERHFPDTRVIPLFPELAP
jgi:hypothetical protein